MGTSIHSSNSDVVDQPSNFVQTYRTLDTLVRATFAQLGLSAQSLFFRLPNNNGNGTGLLPASAYLWDAAREHEEATSLTSLKAVIDHTSVKPNHATKDSGNRFVSSSVLVEGQMLYLVLRVSLDANGAHEGALQHPHPWQNRQGLAEFDVNAQTPQTFLGAVATVLAQELEWIARHAEGRSHSAEDILSAAGKLMMGAMTLRLGMPSSGSDLYELFNQISIRNYEHLETDGMIVFCRPNHPALDVQIRFQQPIPLNNITYLRKMLQASTQQISLLSDGVSVYGLGQLRTGQDVPQVDSDDVWSVMFEKRGIWRLMQHDKVVMQVKFRLPETPRRRMTESEFRARLDQSLPASANASPNHNVLWKLVEQALSQKRGTNILITENAAQVVKALSHQATLVQPFVLHPHQVEQLTSIDGTLVLDTQGCCHAIGAILDGSAARHGNPARGGRYNSAVMHVENSPYPCVIVVISEDGYVDLVGRDSTSVIQTSGSGISTGNNGVGVNVETNARC